MTDDQIERIVIAVEGLAREVREVVARVDALITRDRMRNEEVMSIVTRVSVIEAKVGIAAPKPSAADLPEDTK
jgi:hypothetical protein